MVTKRTRRKKVSFTATRIITKKENVSFKTTKGENVSFRSIKKVPQKVKVEFYAKRKRQKRK